MVIGGIFLSTTGGFLLHLIPNTMLLIFSGVAWVGAGLLFALAPPGANYWAFTFPAMICATLGIDITFNVANIFITTNMVEERQGLAGSLSNSVLQLGIALLLGFADLAQTEVQKKGAGLRESYKAVFWFMVACAGLALVIMAGFVRVKKAKSEMTADEKRALAAAAAGGGGDVRGKDGAKTHDR